MKKNIEKLDKLEEQQLNKLKSSMEYIESLIIYIEDVISGKKKTYEKIHNDLTQEQTLAIKNEIKNIRALLKKTKKDFDLEHQEFSLSHVINVKCNFIWETIEDLRSQTFEKSSGKITSQQKKEEIDSIVKQLFESTMRIKGLVKKNEDY
ncbi:MAG: hypothetical protein QXG00_01635 [Candidatus Woesearchaeota archaeon]